MYRILVPIDSNEKRALTQAEHVASLPGGEDSIHVVLQYVFHDEGEVLPDEFSGKVTADRIGSVRRASELLEDHGIDYSIVEGSGNTAEDILRKAEEEEADLIVLGGRKRSPAGKILFGSVAQEVLLNTKLPVTVTGSKS